MKSYSVKQIADLLGTNQETVRRWIRSGKLKAVDDNKKKGESKTIPGPALHAFLKASPKYSALLGSLSSAGVGGLAVAGLVGVTAGSMAVIDAKTAEEKKLLKVRVSEDSFFAFLADKIATERENLEKLLSEREELDRKIQTETTVLNKLLEQLNGLDGATINQKKTKEE